VSEEGGFLNQSGVLIRSTSVCPRTSRNPAVIHINSKLAAGIVINWNTPRFNNNNAKEHPDELLKRHSGALFWKSRWVINVKSMAWDYKTEKGKRDLTSLTVSERDLMDTGYRKAYWR